MEATTPEDLTWFVEAAKLLEPALMEGQIQQFAHMRALLLDWNERINLTTIAEPQTVLSKHILDSLSCLLALDEANSHTSQRLLDIGSGAGFPGLVLAIARPDWQVVSLEATAKKVRFQELIIETLGLSNATTVYGRAEVLAHEAGWRGSFSIVTARAVAPLPTLLEWCQPFSRIGGLTIAPKKGNLADELAQGERAANVLGGAVPEIIPLPNELTAKVPDLADERVIIRVKQVAPAPPRYPRSGATPVKSPLGR
jgi:16S rRNA (guanine527-N7)-methyltransferase